MQEQEQDLDTGVNPTYEEVVAELRAQLGYAQFQVTLLEITNEKLRQRIAELEVEEQADEPTDS